MKTISTLNVHCNQRKKELEWGFKQSGFKNASVNISEKTISFEGDEGKAREVLAEYGCAPIEKKAGIKDKVKYFFLNKCCITRNVIKLVNKVKNCKK